MLAKIREHRQEENTLIFFFSDNGGPTAQTTSGNGPAARLQVADLGRRHSRAVHGPVERAAFRPAKWTIAP